MAITIDQAQICTPATGATSGSTFVITTNQIVAANALIVLAVMGDPPVATVSSVSGGSLTWTIDKQGVAATSSDVAAVISAPAVSGLASGTAITITYNTASSAVIAGGSSFNGCDLTGTRVDGTPTQNNLATNHYTSGNITIAAGSMIVAAGEIDQNTTAAAPTTGVKAWSLGEAVGGNTLGEFYRIDATGGSLNIDGLWGTSGSNTTIAVGYKAAAGATALPPLPRVVDFAVSRSTNY